MWCGRWPLQAAGPASSGETTCSRWVPGPSQPATSQAASQVQLRGGAQGLVARTAQPPAAPWLPRGGAAHAGGASAAAHGRPAGEPLPTSSAHTLLLVPPAPCPQATFHKLSSAEPQALCTTLWGMATLQMQPPPAWLYSAIGALKTNLEGLNEADLLHSITALKAFNEGLQLDRASELLLQLEQRLQELQAQHRGQAGHRLGREGAAAEGGQRGRRRKQGQQGSEAAASEGGSTMSSLRMDSGPGNAGGGNGNGNGNGVHSQLPLPVQLQGVMPGVAVPTVQEFVSAS
jgi:hypothetical protein